MKREIKFRAWDEAKKHMWHNQFAVSSLGRFHVYEPAREYFKFYPDDFILMQFTGLKDKNGVEIYEGDVGKDVHDEYYEVKFDDGAFVVIHDGNVVEPLSEVASDIEIVSHIYEHPHLLADNHDQK